MPRPSVGGPPPSRAALGLLAQARTSLSAAALASEPAPRYVAAHLAALRAAAAVLAARARPGSTRGPRSAWALLSAVAPELAEWAAFFDAGAARRSAAEAGLTGAVSPRDADDLLRQAGTFLELAADAAGLPAPPALPEVAVDLRAG